MKKTALITGGSSGIGRGAALLFSAKGYDVICVDKTDCKEVTEGIRCINCDLKSPEAIEELISSLSKEIGSIDVLVNNAAVQVSKPLVEITPGEWDLQMDVNVRAAYLLIRATYPVLKKPGASIINVSSVHTVSTSANMAAYAATKGALEAMSRALAVEFASDGIRVNAVLPGAVDTPMLRKSMERGSLTGGGVDERLSVLADKTPLKRIGTAAEIAESILFLSDNERSSFITGTSLVIDGGVLARLSTE
ncbi:MAG: SDR family oxidoreductase [Thermodesulfobacteriota bacterium]